MTRRDQIDSNDYRALAEFRYQIRCFLRSSEEAARQAGIEPQHHQLMLSLKGRPEGEPPRIAYLAERLQLQHHSAVELVDRLVKKGLIRRTRGAGDRREVHVQLTSRGEDVLERLTMHTRAELQTAAPALVAALRRLTARIKPRAVSQRQEAGAALMRRSGS
jgi:DNA-binding MarR family transcriptional regulator